AGIDRAREQFMLADPPLRHALNRTGISAVLVRSRNDFRQLSPCRLQTHRRCRRSQHPGEQTQGGGLHLRISSEKRPTSSGCREIKNGGGGLAGRGSASSKSTPAVMILAHSPAAQATACWHASA